MYVAWALTTLFLQSSGHFNTDPAIRTGALVRRLQTKERKALMSEEIIRCPYCVPDDHFRRMLPRPEGWFVCPQCGHTAIPEKQEFRCFCQKCGELNRAARFNMPTQEEHR